MNDPHVVALVYKIEHSNSIEYKKAKSFCLDEQAFRLEVADEMARFEMHSHFPTFEEADKALTEYRCAWEFDVQLERGPDTFHLVLDRGKSELIDRNPTPGHVQPDPICFTFSVGHARGTVRPLAYPEPPCGITLTPDVETMYNRYMGYRENREPLASMANFCLTVLEDSTGKTKNKRRAAATIYSIEKRVLNKIGELADTKGGEKARKRKGIENDFSTEEHRFLEHAVKAIIRRMAEGPSYGDTLSMITMSDLPSLDNDSDFESEANG